jgi:predicted nucleotidyltransferase
MKLEPYIEFVKEKMNVLSSFPQISPVIYEAIRKALEEYSIKAEIYFFGSIIEGKFTVMSDIDIAILVDKVPERRKEIVRRIFELLENKGLPWWLPLEIHFFTPSLFDAFKKGGANFIKAEDYIKKREELSR